MLPGHIAGHYPREALDIDLVRLARFAGARLILGAAEAFDPVAREIRVAGRRAPVCYDLASIDVGITSAMPDLPGFAAHETLLYSPELKFYSNRIKMDLSLNTSIGNFYALGDSSGWTRGLMMASMMGVVLGNRLAEEEKL